jgi:Lar family restriction alleviation protein
MTIPSDASQAVELPPLKPCPFCGGAAQMTFVSDFQITHPRTGRRVICSNCPGQTSAVAYEHEAVELWNRRATIAAQAEPSLVGSLPEVLNAALRSGIAHNNGAGGQYLLCATEAQLLKFAAAIAQDRAARAQAEPVARVVRRCNPRPILPATMRLDWLPSADALPDGEYGLYAAPVMPASWVPCTITYVEGEDPEEVAFGPQRMMDRLKKWLDSYFAMLYAQRYPAARAQGAGEPSLRDKIADLFKIGADVRSDETIIANVTNAVHLVDCLMAVERELFTTMVQDEDGEPGDMIEDCSVNSWGSEPAQYVEQVRAALAAVTAPTIPQAAEVPGFVLVPREPTPAMMRVGLASMWPRAAYQNAAVENVWIRMCRVGADPSTEEMTLKAIAAAPTPTASAPKPADRDFALMRFPELYTGAPKAEGGHCPEKRKPGGCSLHNLQCGYPKCDQPPSEADRSNVRNAAIERWDSQATALGYSGVSDALDHTPFFKDCQSEADRTREGGDVVAPAAAWDYTGNAKPCKPDCFCSACKNYRQQQSTPDHED